MSETRANHHCLNCGRSEDDLPLVVLRHAGADNWICTQCLPILLHKPAQLAGKLAGAERIPPARHDEH